MLLLFTISLALLLSFVAGHYDASIAGLPIRQLDATHDCNAACAAFTAVKEQCNTPHCGCDIGFVQAQGECLVCQTDTPQDAAAVQYLLDTEMTQCHSEGIKIDFQLQLPHAAAAIVKAFNRQNAQLKQQQTAFLALQIAGGHIGLVIVLFVGVFSRKAHRDPTFFNFCITWIFSSVVFSTLLYKGTAEHSISNTLGKVSPDICLTQAALTHGVQVMTASSTMALVIQLWLSLRAAVHGETTLGLKQNRWTTLALLMTPYILFITFTLPVIFVVEKPIVLGGTSLQRALPTNFYCEVVGLHALVRAAYGVTLGTLVFTLVIDVLIIKILCRRWWAIRNAQNKGLVSLSTLLRVMVFSIFRVVVAIAYALLLEPTPHLSTAVDNLSTKFGVPKWVDILQATTPLVGSLVLGVKSDMVVALVFWHNKPPDAENEGIPHEIHASHWHPHSIRKLVRAARKLAVSECHLALPSAR